MTTIEGDLNVFLLALFLFMAVVVIPLVSVIIMQYLTNERDIRHSRWEDAVDRERSRHS